ncbi:MAG: nicotinate (nicotinamide) nucleotide adenylyltransferase [Rubrivivax sp.]|nr:nicotinate (nicotinamide) nucleotide adenylyltransferase [Rubrivivax sp.]
MDTVNARIGIFGGSFDPVHNAHLALARTALAELPLDRVLWIPAGQPWQKSRELGAAVHREAMLRLAIGGEPRFTLDRREIDRTGPSYTLDTVRELRAEWPDALLFLLIGQDQYAGLHTWDHWQDLLQQVVLAVANRPGSPPAVNAAVAAHPHQEVPLAMLDIAATDIRQRVAQGQGIAHLVPPDVARYIEQQGLYRLKPGP